MKEKLAGQNTALRATGDPVTICKALTVSRNVAAEDAILPNRASASA
jgi:hypothetical protein